MEKYFFLFTALKKIFFLNIFTIDLISFQVKTLKEVFHGYQTNLENTANLNRI